MRYPTVQPVQAWPIATAAFSGPTIVAIAVGIVVKKLPLATPFKMLNTVSKASESEKGQIASMLSAFSAITRKNVLIPPNLSHAGPDSSRPTAVHALKPATKPAPVPEEKPNDVATKGKK
ncbi:hypothetical protein KC319_g11942 [Hortaea werneckii]|nr:hypothetical protein KC319_g11942 [Hortaea werneckii]